MRATTRYAALGRRGAAATLAIAAAAAAWAATPAAGGKFAPGPPGGARTDLELYRRVVARVAAGEGYYDAAGAELRAGYYGTRSLFSWRTPLYAWGLGRALPSPGAARAALGALVLAGVLLGFAALGRDGGPAVAWPGAALVLLAMAGGLVGETYLLTECWAAPLILAAVLAPALGRPGLGVAAGVLALFVRELAAPAALVGLALAARDGRRREAAAWATGLAGYAAFYAWHAAQVAGRVTAADPAYPTGWVRFGGPRFVLAAASVHPLLLALPAWATGLYLALAALGLIGWRGDAGRRAGTVAAAYLALFAVAGRPANAYWGLLVAPLLALGVAWSPAALRDLGRAALRGASGTGTGGWTR